MYLVTVAFSLAWGPFFFKSLQDGKENTKRIAYLAGKAITLVFIIAIFGVVISKDFVALVFHDEYHSIASIVPLIIFGYLLSFLYVLFSFGVLQSNKTAMLSAITFITAVLNIVLNIWLIPEFGMEGAEWATVSAFALQAVMVYVISRVVFPIPYPLGKIGIFFILFYIIFHQTQIEIINDIFKYCSAIVVMLILFTIGYSDLLFKNHRQST